MASKKQEAKTETQTEEKKPKESAESQIDPREAKISELTDTLKRLQADFENYKKRVEKEKEQFARYAGHKLVANLLPLLDSFELAIKNSNGNGKNLTGNGADNFKKGIELIYAQFYSILENEGLRQINALSQKFDPYKHEALMQIETDDAHDGIVLEEFQKGYMLYDAVLRHSKVKIGKKKEENTLAENEKEKNQQKA